MEEEEGISESWEWVLAERPLRRERPYSHFKPRLMQREHDGFSLLHRTLALAQISQLSRNLTVSRYLADAAAAVRSGMVWREGGRGQTSEGEGEAVRVVRVVRVRVERTSGLGGGRCRRRAGDGDREATNEEVVYWGEGRGRGIRVMERR